MALLCPAPVLVALERLAKRPQSAQGLVEYALILVLVALVVVLMLIAFGASLRSVYSNISTAIQR